MTFAGSGHGFVRTAGSFSDRMRFAVGTKFFCRSMSIFAMDAIVMVVSAAADANANRATDCS
jgi:hypothetical protein